MADQFALLFMMVYVQKINDFYFFNFIYLKYFEIYRHYMQPNNILHPKVRLKNILKPTRPETGTSTQTGVFRNEPL